MNQNICLTIQYDGTRYHGWQSQKHTSGTIQEKMEQLLSRYFDEPIELCASGRTDAGVHATKQQANFHVSKEVDIEQLREAFFEFLPQDISVTAITPVDNRFHARLNAVGKKYRYRIWNSKQMDVFQRNYVWQIKDPLDGEAMKKVAEQLCGTHDYLSFCSNKHMKKSSVRTVFDIQIQEKDIPFGKEYIFDFYGNGFLYNMVRIMTGTIIESGFGKYNIQDINHMLVSKKRQTAGMTAPPMGLMLMDVYYSEEALQQELKQIKGMKK